GWSSDHKLSGCAYVYVRVTYSSFAFQQIPTITVDVRGRKLYDPRDGQTRWSDNPALCARDYLTHPIYGKGMDEAFIDDASFGSAATQCEERVQVLSPAYSDTFSIENTSRKWLKFDVMQPPFGTGDGVRFATTGTLPAPLAPNTTYYVILREDKRISVATTWANARDNIGITITSNGIGAHTVQHYDYARFTCDGLVNVDATAYDNYKAILTSCLGMPIYSGGKHKLVLDRPIVATGFDFSQDNIVGGWSIKQSGKQSRYNRVSANIFNGSKNWQADIAQADSSDFRSVDNNLILERSMSLPFTQSIYRATAICWQVLNQSRYGVTVMWTAFPSGLRCEVGDVVSITHPTPGWNGKLFRVLSISLLDSGDVQLSAREYDPSTYVTGPMPSVELTPSTLLPDPLSVEPPSNLATVESLYTTIGSSGLKTQLAISWFPSPDAMVAEYQIEGKLASEQTFRRLGSESGTLFVWRDVTPGIYDIRIRAVNEFGKFSTYATRQCTVEGLTAIPASMEGLTLSAIGGMAHLRWNRSPDLDVQIGGRIEFRWSPAMSGASWNDSISIGDAISGDQTTAILPLSGGTYMGRFYDSSGIASATVAKVTTKFASALSFTNASTITFEPLFTGSGSGTAVVDSTLRLDAVDQIDSWDLIDSIADIDSSTGVLFTTGTRELSMEFDWGSVVHRRLRSSITASVHPAGDPTAAINVMLECAQTDDDPTGSPTWTPWSRLNSAEVIARAVKFRAVFMSDGTSNIIVSNMSVVSENL
ncbi:MAG: phage tail protein, partial [Magnetococcus sp. DMHC-8]